MKACIVGKGILDFKAEDSGDEIKGVKLYYFAPKDEVEGFFAGEMFVREKSRLYNKVMCMDTEKPFLANIEYGIQPGRKRTVAVLADIRPLDEEEIISLSEDEYWKNSAFAFVTA